MSQEQKNKIRKYFFDKRLDLSQKYIISESKLICQKAINYIKKQKNIKNIALYHPINNEVNLYSLHQFFEKNDYNIFLPKIIQNNLEFGYFKKDNLTHNHKIPKIIEPINITNKIMDIVICPLVCFDKNNNRIGMGGGFYDILIEKSKKNNYHTKFIGIAYKEQYYDKLLPIEKFDQKLDLIITLINYNLNSG